MIRILDQWKGKFEVNGEIYTDLYDFDYEDGEEFHIRMLSKRREDVRDDEESLSVHSSASGSRYSYRY